mgnify:FL=1
MSLRSRNTFVRSAGTYVVVLGDVYRSCWLFWLAVVFTKMLPENFMSKKLYSEHKVAHFSVLYGKKDIL